MKKVIVLVTYELKNLWSDRKSLFFTFFIPLGILVCIFLFVVMILKKQSMQQFDVALVDYDQTLETRVIIQQFTNSQQLTDLINIVQTDEASAMSMLSENRVVSMIVIPKNFSADLVDGKNTPVVVVGNSRQPLQSLLVKSLMESAANFVTAAQSGVNTVYGFLREAYAPKQMLQNELTKSIFTFTLHSLGRSEVFHQEEITDFAIRSPTQYYYLSGLIVLLELWGLMLTGLIQKEEKLFQKRMLLYGVGKKERVLANLLSLGLSLFFQATIVVVAASLLGEGQTIRILLAISVVSLNVSSLFIFLSTVISVFALFNLTALGAILFFTFIGGGIIPLAYLPAAFTQFSAISLNKWALDLLLKASEGTIALLSVVILTASTISCCVLTVFIEGWKENAGE